MDIAWQACRMIGLGGHQRHAISEEFTEDVSVSSIEFREDIIEEKERFFARNFLDITTDSSYTGEQESLIFTTREYVFCEHPGIIFFNIKSYIIEMRANSRTSDGEISVEIFSYKIRESFSRKMCQFVTVFEYNFDWSGEVEFYDWL